MIAPNGRSEPTAEEIAAIGELARSLSQGFNRLREVLLSILGAQNATHLRADAMNREVQPFLAELHPPEPVHPN
jgi:hypothetical protein